MLVRSGRRLAAGIVAVLACAALTVPSAASAAGGTYTQILCADPDSGAGVIPDSQLPDGLTNPSTFPSMSTASTTAGCTSGSGIALPTAADTNDPYKGGALVYRAGDGVKFQRAMLHRRYLDQSNWSLFVHRAADWTWAYASPFTERCDAGCAQLGSGEGFATSTRTLVAAGSEETNGFSFAVLCEIPDSTRRCTADGSRGLRLWGGRVTLEDAANPQVSGTPSGSLVRDTVLRDTADLTFNATDAGSGLYRVRCCSTASRGSRRSSTRTTGAARTCCRRTATRTSSRTAGRARRLSAVPTSSTRGRCPTGRCGSRCRSRTRPATRRRCAASG
jgi:hypothetical protein